MLDEIIIEPKFNAKICHFGAADLSVEIPELEEEKIEEREEEDEHDKHKRDDEISIASSPRVWRRSGSRRMRIEGTHGYIAHEVIAGDKISYKSDVFAFGVVILELISGREPLKYTMNRQTNDYELISMIETGRQATGMDDDDGASEAEADERIGRIRRWVDWRLQDSFPVEVSEKLIRVALRCVQEETFMRPDMRWVVRKILKLFLNSHAWEERIRFPTDFFVSLAPR